MPEELIPNEISEEQLKAGYWFVTHKLLLKRILIVGLIVLNAGLFGFSGYGFVLDLIQAPERAAMIYQLATDVTDHAWYAAASPQPLQISNAQVLAPQGKYDFLATLRNGNANYAARFTYRFVAGDFATAPQAGFVLPNEEKFLVSLGQAAGSRPANAALELSDIRWQRIDRHEIPDWSAFANEHLNLAVGDTLYEPAIALPDGKTIGKTVFTIDNRTGYGYYDVKAVVVMYRGPAAVGVNSTVFPVLPPAQSQGGEVTWFEDFGAVTKIVVQPQVDILDDSAYFRVR